MIDGGNCVICMCSIFFLLLYNLFVFNKVMEFNFFNCCVSFKVWESIFKIYYYELSFVVSYGIYYFV